jgi:hypothetical protein
MKRFATLLTVSVTMAVVAFADNPVTDPDFGHDVGFPFHPGAYISTTLDADNAWNECFCMPGSTYELFPGFTTQDPTLIESFDVMRMTSGMNSGAFAPATYLQNPDMKDWTDRVLDMTFYFAAQGDADALGYYISDTQLTAEPMSATSVSGLSFVITRVGGTSTASTFLDIYDLNGHVGNYVIPVFDSNFHLLRVRYDDLYNMVKVDLFEFLAEVEVVGWTPVNGPSTGYLGFGGFAMYGGYQYIDDICLTITDEHDQTVDSNVLPGNFELAQNVPNPFNPATTINYMVPATGEAALRVFDLAGRNVATLVDGMVEEGQHSVVFDASNMASGVYFYTLETAGMVETRKMVLVK